MSTTSFLPRPASLSMAFSKRACHSLDPACYIDLPDLALERIISFIDCPRSRATVSLVCRKWHDMENYTRKEVTVAFCYTTTPSRLSGRFTKLQSLRVKGKPRADMYNLMPQNWGAYAEPWVKEVALKCPCLNSLHFRRMVVSDEDLQTLAQACGNRLRVLKLDRCSGFSTIGLQYITHYCRQLRVLFLDDSSIEDLSGNWLKELALHNSSLEVLNFHATFLSSIDVADLDAIAANCRLLRSLKVSDVELSKLSGVLSRATCLRELAGVSLSGNYGQGNGTLSSLPTGLTSLGLMYMGDDYGDTNIIPLIQPLAPGLKKLDLQLAGLSLEGHCQLLQHFNNLDVLEVLNGIGDEGLEVVGANCRNLRRLRVESGDRDFQQGYVTQRGLLAIAQGCNKLEYIALYMSDINNAALQALGEGCPKLKDFRLVLLLDEFPNPDFPLDSGVHALLEGCRDLTRLALYLKQGALSNTGMQFIGKLGKKLRWILLGLLGHSDEGFSWLADGCPNLERLEMRDCVFSEAGIARSILKLRTLKYVWVQGYKATPHGQNLLAMRVKPFWNVEFIPEQRGTSRVEHEGLEFQGFTELTRPAQFLAYNSLAGKRLDCPETVIQLV
ncbi:hypothetical protein GOP47_0016185 [Adiantum capillus-veneris]|uniref:F-box domain-containing protein n=1 Tax=Adiantum capillus-veneris TaxID=13818 RepID=A0A9D4ULN7_ADICA|nr:hypothetical protein GOP47_0016185 [Adiantum capillus-veneris]